MKKYLSTAIQAASKGESVTNGTAKWKWCFRFAAVMLVTASVISAVVFSAKRQQSSKVHRKEWLTSPPPVLSKVKDLEIINARIVRPNTNAPGVAFEIRNNSNLAVMAVDIMCGEAGIAKDGLGDEEHPTVVIEPYGTLPAEMNGELTPGAPIVITAATYEDGTEEGTESSLNSMGRGREYERARLKAQKEQRSPGRGPNQ